MLSRQRSGQDSNLQFRAFILRHLKFALEAIVQSPGPFRCSALFALRAHSVPRTKTCIVPIAATAQTSFMGVGNRIRYFPRTHQIISRFFIFFLSSLSNLQHLPHLALRILADVEILVPHLQFDGLPFMLLPMLITMLYFRR
ncbi:MAG: hypothetical protein [Circoviridae sp.]|nr:MAG: hypothetical protein [Circoviridae sp.]